MAAISHHRPTGGDLSDFAKKSDRLVKNTLKIIRAFPKAKFYIENPRAVLRKMPFMQDIPKATVTYCSYGDTRMKPTDIFTNNVRDLLNPDGWQPRPMCFNGNRACHHSGS